MSFITASPPLTTIDAGSLTVPLSSTDNAIVRWSGVAADTVKDSAIIIDNSGNLLCATDDTATFGALADNRPKRIFASERMQVGDAPASDFDAYPGFIVAGQIDGANAAYAFMGANNAADDISMGFIRSDLPSGFVGFHLFQAEDVLSVVTGSGGTDRICDFDTSDLHTKVRHKMLATEGIGVGNSADATTLGTVTKKMQVFDASGNSLGYVAIYDAIT